MKIGTINVGGWSSTVQRKNGICRIMQILPDILAIQEPNTTSLTTLNSAFFAEYNIISAKLSGLIIRKTHPIANHGTIPNGRVTWADISINNQATRVISAYAPARLPDRQMFFADDDMQLLRAHYTGATILLGDLNDYPNNLLDRSSSASGTGVGRCWDTLTPFLEDFTDIPRALHPDTPLFSNTVTSRGEVLTRTRIDHIFTNTPYDLSLHTVTLHAFPHSQHSLVLWNWAGRPELPHAPEIPRGDGTWSLHIGHIKDENIQRFIEAHLEQMISKHRGPWSSEDWLSMKSSTLTIIRRITKTARSTTSAEAVTQLQEQLAAMDLQDPRIKSTMQKLQREEEILHTVMTAKLQKWSTSMELLPSCRYEKTMAPPPLQIRMADGIKLATSVRELTTTAHDFYKKATTPDPATCYTHPSSTTEGLGRENIVNRGVKLPDYLTLPVTPDEVSIKIRSAPNGSSPGIDGLPYEFSKRHASTLVPVLAAAINSVLDTGTLGPTQQLAYPTLLGKLLPKKVPPGGDAHNLKFKRPLNIADTNYRIASLVVNQRLAPYAARIITGNQTAFLKGRGMEENGLTHYLLHELSADSFTTIDTDDPSLASPTPSPNTPTETNPIPAQRSSTTARNSVPGPGEGL
ncbi:DNase I-like protein [Ascobolus immersus RN42]|uniref:DNase I-like protein n=1 Tax=Ascobolus immersus RN42 TaxID=1160509 RepID=A0A3N4H901_ASCIM|nr:DNase I-like protein [Ascobolus immersus RN42]